LIALQAAPQVTLDFAGLVKEHQSMVFSVCWHFLHDRDQAEDVAQEVFLGLHRNMASIQSAAHAGHWLRKVAVQRAIDAGRRRFRRPQVSLADVAEPAAETPVRDPMLGETLRKLIATLPETPRMVMVLRYQEDLDPAEIGQVMEMPVATVKSHLQRSLALLREKLARRGVREERWTG
jgi:RNA polymerase sigma-70 factor (ECF subfamily)